MRPRRGCPSCWPYGPAGFFRAGVNVVVASVSEQSHEVEGVGGCGCAQVTEALAPAAPKGVADCVEIGLEANTKEANLDPVREARDETRAVKGAREAIASDDGVDSRAKFVPISSQEPQKP